MHDTNFECILEDISEKTDKDAIKAHIIDLERIVIGFVSVDLVHNKINNLESFEFLNDDIVKFKAYRINLETLEIAGEPKEFDDLLPEVEPLDFETQEKIKAIVCAVYRKNIENFVDFEFLRILKEKINK